MREPPTIRFLDLAPLAKLALSVWVAEGMYASGRLFDETSHIYRNERLGPWSQQKGLDNLDSYS